METKHALILLHGSQCLVPTFLSILFAGWSPQALSRPKNNKKNSVSQCLLMPLDEANTNGLENLSHTQMMKTRSRM